MDYIITAIVFILIFSLLILVHEFGHFIMAKRAGIKVEEFGFGLPPRIWGKKKGETVYSINWIPFGGFVRMLGESDVDNKIIKNKRSFVAAPMRKRVKVVIAGVLMNFFLAWLLLTVGLSVGMEPLLTPDDVLPAITDGTIVLQEGVEIKDVEEDSLADRVGFEEGDVIYMIDDQLVNEFSIADALIDPLKSYKIVRNDEIFSYEILPENMIDIDKGKDNVLGVTFDDYVSMPRVMVFDVDKYSTSYSAGIRSGDIILQVNGHQIYSVEEYEQFIRGEKTLEYEIYRDGRDQTLIVETNPSSLIVISRVLPNTPAEKAGLKEGDIIYSVNAVQFFDSEELIEFSTERSEGVLAYMIERDGERIFYEIEPEDGKIGVLLSELRDYGEEQDISLYNVDLLSTVSEIKEVKYPVYKAIYKSFSETYRFSVLTVKMFKGFATSLVSKGEVPDTVAGPVGIAQMTYGFLQEGFVAVIRFVAILSLSLAVINILPFPALDGGRLLFIIIELILGRRINAKWEAHIHALGYVLILLLILAVTYSDILRAFGL